MPKAITHTISLLGGAALGAVAMYLLDPDSGADRRQDVSGAAADAVTATRSAVGTSVGGATGSAQSAATAAGKYAKGFAGRVSGRAGDASDAVHSGVAAASDHAHSIASRIAKYAKELAGKVSGQVGGATDAVGATAASATDSAQSIAGKIASYAKQLAGHVSGHVEDAKGAAKSKRDDWLDSAADAARPARSYGASAYKAAQAQKSALIGTVMDTRDNVKAKARRLLGIPEPHPVATATGITAGSIAVLALGAGLMYYMDPERGRTRRTLLRDRVTSMAHQSRKRARAYGHHLGNKAHGYVAQVKSAVPPDWVDTAKSVVGSDDDQG